MSVNKDWDGMEFISSIEHKRYPFYGIQFHPEKNLYEWARNKNISHTAHAIFASKYFADFFVNEARKSKHSFQDATDEDNYVIYNFPASFTGLKGSAFEQCYMFDAEEKYNHQTASEVGASGTIIFVNDFVKIFLMKCLLQIQTKRNFNQGILHNQQMASTPEVQ